MRKEIRITDLHGSPSGACLVLSRTDDRMSMKASCVSEPVWLTADQMASLFGADAETVEGAISAILDSGDLDRLMHCSFTASMPPGSSEVLEKDLYSLDVAVAVGMRLDTPVAAMFRRWTVSLVRDRVMSGR